MSAVSLYTNQPALANDMAEVIRLFLGNVELLVNEAGGELTLTHQETEQDGWRAVTVTDGYVGADLFALCREAGLNAYRSDKHVESVTADDFKAALYAVKPSVDSNTEDAYRKLGPEMKKRKDRWSDVPFYS